MWLLFLWQGLFIEAAVFEYSFRIGTFDVHYIYNNDTYLTDKVALVRYNQTTGEVWFQGVSATSTTSTLSCRRASQERIVTGPIGCSDVSNPALALQSSNCIPNEVDVVERRAIFQKVWYLSKESNECFLGGGDGDPRLCMGPLRLSLDNQDSFIPRDFSTWPTERDLLAARMAFVETVTGPYAMAPALFEVPLRLPALRVVTDCGLFNQSYVSFSQDAYSATVGEVWKVFRGTQFQDLAVAFERYGGEEGVDFRVVFGSAVGVAGGYTLSYATGIQNATLGGSLLITARWLDLLEFDTPYQMYNYTTGAAVCMATFSMDSPSSRFTLEDIYYPTANNYSWNLYPRRFWALRVCNFHVGRLTHSNDYFYAGCPPGDACGGDVLYTYPAYPHLPIYVPPNPTLDFRLSCEEFYPKNESFLDYGQDGTNGRSLQNRMNVLQQLCFAPFPLPELVQLQINPDEKYRQCQYLGGFTWGLTQTMCAMVVTQTYCKKGWYYANQNCYYKFSPTTEGKYAVPIDQAPQACLELDPLAKALVEVDERLEAWLLGTYLYQKTDLDTAALYRVPQYRSPRCLCFDSSLFTKGQCDCYGIEERGLSIFPVCFYPRIEPSKEPEYAEVGVSLQTARLWTYGQEGPKPSGFEAECECYSGWTGKVCERQTCPLRDILEAPPADLTTLTTFFRKCYTEGHGSCWNGQPRVCQCDYPYQPHASIVPEFTSLFQFRDWPCACPAAQTVESTFFQLNEVGYEATTALEALVCSGITQGACLVDNSTNVGRCLCRTRQNLLLGVEEPTFDGQACSCERPIQPWAGEAKNGRIVSLLCNNKGLCCPFGQSVGNPQVGDFYNPRCFTPEGEGLSGCACDNGWGGESCTCPTPFDYAYEKLKSVRILGGEEFLYVDLGGVYFINFIRFTGCAQPTLVRVTNDLSTESSVDCVYNTTSLLYECASSLSHQFVVYQGSLECTVAAFQSLFQFCGANGTANVFAGRFYALPVYRGRYNNLLQQYTGVANFGCTNTECMCGPDWGGALCAAGVSSIRETVVEVDGQKGTQEAKLYCGESVLVPRLSDAVAGRGVVDPIYKNCSCNAISNVDATGRVGKVTERFVGSSCECATGYNQNYREVLECAGHGECDGASFPYGSCEVDLLNYRADALYTPYVESSSFTSLYTELLFEEDSYFYKMYLFDTLAPTKRPTAAPTEPTATPTRDPTTAEPTKSPTINPTKAPTVNPTISPTVIDEIVLYNLGVQKNGALGDSFATSVLCRARAVFLSLDCADTPMFISYNSSYQILDFPTIYGFSTSVRVVSNTNVQIRNSWANLFSVGGIDIDLATAIGITNLWWSGTQSNGQVQSGSNGQCSQWSSSASFVTGKTGSDFLTNSGWISFSSQQCGLNRNVVCMCTRGQAPTASPIPPSSTASPTPATSSPTPPTLSPTPPTLSPTPPTLSPTPPTLSPTPPTLSPTPPTASPTPPTKNPTTKTPTKSPTLSPTLKPVIIYSVGYTDQAIGGALVDTESNCAYEAGILGLTCIDTPPFLCYSTQTVSSLPTIYGFSSAKAVYSSSGVLIKDTWANMISSQSITNSMQTAGVVVGDYWTGCTTSGTLSDNCADGTSGIGNARYGTSTATNSDYISAGIEFCAVFRPYLCVCI